MLFHSILGDKALEGLGVAWFFRPLGYKRFHLRLEFCLIYGHRLPCCRSCLFTLSKPGRAHQKNTNSFNYSFIFVFNEMVFDFHYQLGKITKLNISTLLVDPAGIEPASRIHPLNQIYSHFYAHC